MDTRTIIEYWIKGAEEDYETAQLLFSGARYAHALFFCHLTIEKTLKALVVKNTGEHAPYDHSLTRLLELTGLERSPEQLKNLIEINSFNLKGRYDDYKFHFYEKATKEYTKKYFEEVDKLFLWLKEQLTK